MTTHLPFRHTVALAVAAVAVCLPWAATRRNSQATRRAH